MSVRDRNRIALRPRSGMRHATGPKISSCAMRMRLSTSAKTVGQTKFPARIALRKLRCIARSVGSAAQKRGPSLCARCRCIRGPSPGDSDVIIGPMISAVLKRIAYGDSFARAL